MITMDLKQQILHLYRVDEKSLREISRELNVDRKTVTRLVREYESALVSNPETGMDEFLATTPKYKKRKSVSRVIGGDIAKEIDKCLRENERRRSAGMRKQCLKNTDIHRLLLEKGMKVSYSGICKYISRKKSEKVLRTKDVYLKIHREPGIECEFDWGEVKLFIAGRKETLMMAVFAFPYSSGRAAYLFHRQDTLAFMESHRNFFHDAQGVPYVMVYDNMRVAVVFDQNEKKPTEALMRLSTFYKFEWRFCNARAGWEKGGVERSVEYVRRRAFTTRVDFDSIEDAQRWLNDICVEINNEEGTDGNRSARLEEDINALQDYPGRIGCFEMAEYTVDKQATICVGKNHYSVPDTLAGKKVIVQIYSEKLVIYDSEHRKVATHERSYATNRWILDISHYVTTLTKKTAALEHSEAFHQMPLSIQDIYHKHFKSDPKEFLNLVKYVRNNDISYDDVVEAAALLKSRGVKKYTTDQLKVALHTLRSEEGEFTEEQQTDSFLEIQMGSEDILNQLENVMQKGTRK